MSARRGLHGLAQERLIGAEVAGLARFVIGLIGRRRRIALCDEISMYVPPHRISRDGPARHGIAHGNEQPLPRFVQNGEAGAVGQRRDKRVIGARSAAQVESRRRRHVAPTRRMFGDLFCQQVQHQFTLGVIQPGPFFDRRAPINGIACRRQFFQIQTGLFQQGPVIHLERAGSIVERVDQVLIGILGKRRGAIDGGGWIDWWTARLGFD